MRLKDQMKTTQYETSIYKKSLRLASFCGERGIRTPGTLTSTPVFKTGSFDHSDISPRLSSLL